MSSFDTFNVIECINILRDLSCFSNDLTPDARNLERLYDRAQAFFLVLKDFKKNPVKAQEKQETIQLLLNLLQEIKGFYHDKNNSKIEKIKLIAERLALLTKIAFELKAIPETQYQEMLKEDSDDFHQQIDQSIAEVMAALLTNKDDTKALQSMLETFHEENQITSSQYYVKLKSLVESQGKLTNDNVELLSESLEQDREQMNDSMKEILKKIDSIALNPQALTCFQDMNKNLNEIREALSPKVSSKHFSINCFYSNS